LHIGVLFGIIAVFASFFGYFPALLSKPIIIAILIAVPFLFIFGGLLAPLELLKSIGNIISYVRIMAIGLTSVLLAYVANQLAGEMGMLFSEWQWPHCFTYSTLSSACSHRRSIRSGSITSSSSASFWKADGKSSSLSVNRGLGPWGCNILHIGINV
jgi:ABC-type uncharacterized transport system permease subunit